MGRKGKPAQQESKELRTTLEKNLENRILRHRHHLQTLSRVSSAVSELWDLDAILNVSLDAVLEVLNGAVGGILLLDKETQRLRYRVYRGLSARYVEGMQMSLGEGIAGKVALSGEPILLRDISQDPRAVFPDLVSTEGLKGFTSVPLKAKDKVVGVMDIARHAPGQLGVADLHFLTSIGYQIGTAIEKGRLYQELEQGKERYRALLQHALTAQEEERKRIARELHDETSQAITGLTLNLQSLNLMGEAMGITHPEFIGMLKKTQALATHIGKEILRLMKELRPALLDELGLAAAINRYAKDMLEPRGIEVETQCCVNEHVPPEVEVTVFRIAQGVIGNILEHSAARHTHIKLESSARECVLRIEDDGRGFDVSRITGMNPIGRGAGIFTMQERVSPLGGTCSITSQPGKGTEVVVRVPLREDMSNGKDTSADS